MSGFTLVKQHLLTYLPTLSGLTDPDAVGNGARLAQSDLTGYAEVGGNASDTNAGSFRQTDDEIDTLVTEEGEVTVRFTARSGSTGDLATLESTCEGWVTSLRQHVKADQTLGGVLMQGSAVNLGRVDVGEAQTQEGAIVTYTVAVSYITRL